MQLAAGGRLGRYEILGALGAGGMGEVYEAFDPRLKRRIALKTLASGVAGDADRIARFAREAESVAALNHPNIVMLHSMEEADGVPFLTMELVEGQPLSNLITAGGLTVERVVGWAMDICNAVATAHDQGVIHRDLKPANIMVTKRGDVKVLDFGLSKFVGGSSSPSATTCELGDTLTGAGVFIGSVGYMSPEQVEGKRIDQRSDVFSFGIVLYEMLTGERPFKGDSHVSAVRGNASVPRRPGRRNFCKSEGLLRGARHIGDPPEEGCTA